MVSARQKILLRYSPIVVVNEAVLFCLYSIVTVTVESTPEAVFCPTAVMLKGSSPPNIKSIRCKQYIPRGRSTPPPCSGSCHRSTWSLFKPKETKPMRSSPRVLESIRFLMSAYSGMNLVHSA